MTPKNLFSTTCLIMTFFIMFFFFLTGGTLALIFFCLGRKIIKFVFVKLRDNVFALSQISNYFARSLLAELPRALRARVAEHHG